MAKRLPEQEQDTRALSKDFDGRLRPRSGRFFQIQTAFVYEKPSPVVFRIPLISIVPKYTLQGQDSIGDGRLSIGEFRGGGRQERFRLYPSIRCRDRIRSGAEDYR